MQTLAEEYMEKGVLENGITYYICKSADIKKRIKLRLIVKCGSLMESAGLNGIAHFLEHMCIESSIEHFKEIKKSLEFNVSVLGGYTNFEYTAYRFTCSYEYLNKALDIFRYIILSSSLNEGLMGKVKEQLKNELTEVMSSAKYNTQQKILPFVFGNEDIINYFPLGKKEDIDKLTYKQVYNFHNKWYKTENISLLVCGDIDETKKLNIYTKINEYFSFLKAEKLQAKASIMSWNISKYNVIVNQVPREGFKVQFYYSNNAFKLDVQAEIVELITLYAVKWYIDKKIKENNSEMFYFNVAYKRLLQRLKINVLEFTAEEEFISKFKFVIKSIKKITTVGFNKDEYEEYKREFFYNIKKADNSYSFKDIMGECLNNFIYGEPLMDFNKEYEYYMDAIKYLSIHKFNKKLQEIINMRGLNLVITSQKKLQLDCICHILKDL